MNCVALCKLGTLYGINIEGQYLFHIRCPISFYLKIIVYGYRYHYCYQGYNSAGDYKCVYHSLDTDVSNVMNVAEIQ